MVASVGGVDPHDLMAAWELRLAALPSIRERIVPYVASLGKDTNSKFEVQCLLEFILHLQHINTLPLS